MLFDQRLVDPKQEGLLWVLDAATVAANATARDRKIKMLVIRDMIGVILLKEAGCLQQRGGEERLRTPSAMVAVVALAWWTDGLGRRHVRVAADKIRVRQGHAYSILRPSAFRDDAAPLFMVYPQLVGWSCRYTHVGLKALRGTERRLIEQATLAPTDYAVRAVAADWLEETGYTHAAALERQAAEFARGLLGGAS